MSVDNTKVSAVVTALVSKFEQLSNKKNEITGDFTSDTASYPTVQAVKTFITSVVEGLHDVATTGDYGDLENVPVFDIVKQATAESGFASTYYMTVDGVQVGAKINVEKDKMFRSVSVETVGDTPTADESEYNLETGDQYILMVVETADNDGATNLILPIGPMFDLQRADETSLTLIDGVYSVKAGGITSNELASDSVTTVKITDGNVTTAKIDAKAVTKAKLADEVQAQWIMDADSEIDDYLDALALAINNI